MDSSSSLSKFVKGIPALTAEKKPLTWAPPATNPVHKQQQPVGTNPVVPRTEGSIPKKVSTNEGNSIFSAADDNVMMKQVLDTHLPDGTDVDVRPLLLIIQDIIKHSTIHADPVSSDEHADSDKPDPKPQHNDVIVMLSSLSHIIDKLASEMALKTLTSGDGHATALALFPYHGELSLGRKASVNTRSLCSQLWRILAAGSNLLINHLAKSMAILKQVPTIMEHTAPLKPRFDALQKLLQSILELTQCIVEFRELPSVYITPDIPAMASAIATIPTAVYWNIRGVIASAVQVASLATTGNEYGISSRELQSWELSTLTLKINHIHDFLKQQLDNFRRVIGDKKEIEFRKSFNQLFETVQIDNMKILKILISPRDDIQPLFDGSTKKRVSLEVLRRRNVLLLISGLDMSRDEVAILEEIYGESRGVKGKRVDGPYEMVWMPIVDPSVQYTDAMNLKFEELRDRMPWYSVYHPSIIDQAVVKSIGDRWHFRNRPILVVLDTQGRELSPNAMHMMWIWGSNAFPFTSRKEELLWKDETWRLELLVSGLDPTILNWIRQDKYILLYGGDDIEWIRKFTNTARAMATATGIPLEMAYVGKGKKKESVRRAMAAVTVEKLSHGWQETTLMWFFWTRLESMLYSKIQLKRADDEDHMMQQIKKVLSYDKDGSWALFCKGSKVVTMGHGSTMMQTLADLDIWRRDIPTKGFEISFKEYHDKLHVAANNCCRFEFLIGVGRIPEGMKCPECHRLMEKYMAFLCCHDQAGLLEPY